MGIWSLASALSTARPTPKFICGFGISLIDYIEGHPHFAHPISVHMERKIRRILSVALVPFVMPMAC